mmetsp:Transcript_3784/g.9717  ORF Transcript_3784/g.9717 Transcript_3784/m.9717 type:complete len:113 (-) Transcript_3784:30-368(-)
MERRKLVLLLMSVIVAAAGECVVSSLCELCRPEEINLDYCLATGRRVERTCDDGTKEMTTCAATAADEALGVLRFEGWMLVVGGISLYVVQRRKLRFQTLYDRRSQSQHPCF